MSLAGQLLGLVSGQKILPLGDYCAKVPLNVRVGKCICSVIFGWVAVTVRRLISFWLFLFGVFSGAGAIYSVSLRLFDQGATTIVAEIIERYREVLYPFWKFMGSLLGIEVSPLVADVASMVSVISLVILRLIVMLLGGWGLLYVLIPLPERPPFPRMSLRQIFGLDFSKIDHDLNVRQFLNGGFWDYIIVILGLTVLLPISFCGLWKNRWLYNVHGVIAGTPFAAEPDWVAFNFRSMFVKQCIAIIAAVLIFHIIG